MVIVLVAALCFGAFRVSLVFGITSLLIGAMACVSKSEHSFYRNLLGAMIGYFFICAITLPFVDELWLGELPLLAIVQVPKIEFASWLRSGLVMSAIRQLGWSKGSFSPDYLTARPYALAIAYLVVLVLVIVPIAIRTRLVKPFSWLILALLIVAGLDFIDTLIFGTQRSFSLY